MTNADLVSLAIAGHRLPGALSTVIGGPST